MVLIDAIASDKPELTRPRISYSLGKVWRTRWKSMV
jgi:hypothetical protein